ncbi:methylated-DNA--[protein]-cysteine S-methyltransferase [Phyllobacterium sp. OV277]|uniref:methylated-DNA--[protein]-cysteine S-methyltransferase n=1 Tax=Phyllobacterium sp. OV277 TaxID=1882772 RepID=UPI00088CA4E0|nr:methylated-DNA--[protein]-cysteine S-methyltransferase [Phyllobacterium sp. OV277]SDO67225.1 O-6-methylguanine DNA methyltransferase [Phyllobacterium sp. OV277]
MTKTLRYRHIQTPIGPMIAMAGDEGLSLLEFSDRPALPAELTELEQRYGYTIVPGDHSYLDQVDEEITAYFAGELTRFETPLFLPATPFQRTIWSMLIDIPYGETRTYGGMARALGKPNSSRAVGGANGQNRIAIVVPCHRIIGADGSLTGYGGGQPRKRFLLDLEHRITAQASEKPVFHPITAQGSFL